jgi:EAL domain-containing protein (putative c-di-GMP-specific phosphodiesterase class I)
LDGPHAFFPTCSSHEAERLDALRKLNLLDTPPSEAFDRITRMAAQLFQLPVAAVSLTDSDRQWFKSRVGVEHSTIPRMKAPCAQAADEGQMLVITDLQADDHYRDSPLAASGVRFYAGAPLMTNDGYCLGAMCLLGAEPSRAAPGQRGRTRGAAGHGGDGDGADRTAARVRARRSAQRPAEPQPVHRRLRRPGAGPSAWRGAAGRADFMPIVEQTSMVRAATQRVLEMALRQLAAWRAEGMALQIAVNVSAVNLLEPDFCGRVVAGLRRYGLAPASLALEITESALMKNPRLAEATLNALAAAGVHLAIDDFGTGYSSLAYLQRLPAEVVKIDQSFVRGLDRDERKRALVSAMIKLSHDLGHRVVAEGVETPEVAQVLKDAGCDEAQGYWYARPLGPQAFAAWLMDQRRGQAALAA